jgi:hypothetical protein
VAGIQRQVKVDLVKAPAPQFEMLSTGNSLQFTAVVLYALSAVKPVVA